jgi:hypothetical protein
MLSVLQVAPLDGSASDNPASRTGTNFERARYFAATPRVACCAWSRPRHLGRGHVRATALLVLLCCSCGHISSGAATAIAVTSVAAVAQFAAPPALEGRTGICPDYRALRCVGSALCAHDERLGCDVCRCASFLRGSVVIAPGGAATTGDVTIDLSLPPSPWLLPPR